MTVRELIDKLSQCDPNADVAFWGYNPFDMPAYIETVRAKDGNILLEE